MGREIERKFLVDREAWEAMPKPAGTLIAQGYVSNEPGRSVRIRIAGDSAFLTLKGQMSGLSRPEFEYPIPARDARALLRLCEKPLIDKTRTRVRFGEQDELMVAGPYVARYLPEEAAPGDLAVERPEDDDVWIGTGDLFRELPAGHLQIVDRIKDIYKNNRGQTIAPRKVEDKFAGVPGIRRTFLVGDGRPYNVLFIVPDYRDRVLAEGLRRENAREYYRRIVTAANEGLAPYERAINFEVLDRDFSPERGEITGKGSYNRKRIEASFAAVIDDLYRRRTIDLPGPGLRVRIPLWFFRDLGILHDEIVRDREGLRDLNRGLRLPLRPGNRSLNLSNAVAVAVYEAWRQLGFAGCA